MKEMRIPDHLTCLLRNLYAGQEATVRTGHGTTDKQEKDYVKAVYCHLAYLTYMQSISWEMLGWKKHKLESRLLGEISITSEGWAPKNWCFWTAVLEKTPESPLDCKEIQPVHSEGDQPRDFFGRSDAKAETPVLWPPHVKGWLIGKDSDAGRDWGQEEKGTTEDEMAGWHHWLDGHESGWTPGVGDGQGGLVCCNSWGCKESDKTEWLNWTEVMGWALIQFNQYLYKKRRLGHRFNLWTLS